MIALLIRERPGGTGADAGGAERRRATERSLDAVVGGDVDRLPEVPAPDVALWTDDAGLVRAVHVVANPGKLQAPAGGGSRCDGRRPDAVREPRALRRGYLSARRRLRP